MTQPTTEQQAARQAILDAADAIEAATASMRQNGSRVLNNDAYDPSYAETNATGLVDSATVLLNCIPATLRQAIEVAETADAAS